jgi:ABC-type oligopeptide transport system substrate-binding subunit
MMKKNISIIAISFAMLSGFAIAGEVSSKGISNEGSIQLAKATFDETPTSATEDRKLVAESATKTVAVLEQILAENKKTNQLLEQLVAAGAKTENAN